MPAGELEKATRRALDLLFKSASLGDKDIATLDVTDASLLTLQALALGRAADALERIAQTLEWKRQRDLETE